MKKEKEFFKKRETKLREKTQTRGDTNTKMGEITRIFKK